VAHTPPPAHSSAKFRPAFRHRIIDARGRVVPLVRARQLTPEVGPILRRTVKDGNVHRLRFGWIFSAVFLACLLLLPLILSASAAPAFILPPTIPPPPPPAAHPNSVLSFSIALNLAYGAAILLSPIGARRRGIAAMLACFRCRICPGCGYSLAGLAADGEGITRCPECSAAWRLPEYPNRE
jgi:hypothetical protein